MCIICAKPIGYAMPSDDTIQTMMDNNPDGAGFAIADGKSVEIYKGYFTVFELLDALHEMGDLTGCAVVFHTRIGTSGGITSETCHPFPVTSNIETMQSTRVSCRLAAPRTRGDDPKKEHPLLLVVSCSPHARG